MKKTRILVAMSIMALVLSGCNMPWTDKQTSRQTVAPSANQAAIQPSAQPAQLTNPSQGTDTGLPKETALKFVEIDVKKKDAITKLGFGVDARIRSFDDTKEGLSVTIVFEQETEKGKTPKNLGVMSFSSGYKVFDGANDSGPIAVAASPTEIYVIDNTGFEAFPQHKYIHSGLSVNFNDVLTWKLQSAFLADGMFPPYALTVYPSYLKVEEQNYCCDIVYNSEVAGRKEYRKVFYLDRTTLNVIKEDKVARGDPHKQP